MNKRKAKKKMKKFVKNSIVEVVFYKEKVEPKIEIHRRINNETI